MGKRQRRQQPLSTGRAASEPVVWPGPAWAPLPVDPARTSGLEELVAVVQEQRRLSARQRSLVADLVRTGTGWPQIAAALGVSRQAARQQYLRTRAGGVEDG
jgi:hypothetical protein